jgi:hypothetical protein
VVRPAIDLDLAERGVRVVIAVVDSLDGEADLRREHGLGQVDGLRAADVEQVHGEAAASSVDQQRADAPFLAEPTTPLLAVPHEQAGDVRRTIEAELDPFPTLAPRSTPAPCHSRIAVDEVCRLVANSTCGCRH